MHNYSGIEVAIIGMAGQFPGANNINEFWDNLKNGVESIKFFEDEELLAEGEDKNTIKNPNYVKANAFLSDKEYFDGAFFGYTPAEVKLMDPQIRLFHENCWKALEDAGYINTGSQKIGLFAGASSNVNWLNYSMFTNLDNEVDHFSAFRLRDATFMCSRVSYLMNLQGPSIYVNTACSTSLVAVQRACMSLLLRECKIALAGGITIKNYSKKGYVYEEGMIDSRDGHCRAFDSEADGTVGGEGVGIVVLKRLADAIEDGDHIYAVIRGSGVNNDGSQKIAYSAPSVDGQSQAILKALSMAKVPAESISYVEAHGTATKLGDPIEIEGLNNSFGLSEKKYCAIGSVKTNIGHLDIASGVAGLIKTAMSLENRQIPASLNFKSHNPKINFTESPFYVNTELTEWKNDQYPLRAGVSSFGIGGTNAHVILEEAPVSKVSSESREHQLFVFSAKTKTSLERSLKEFKIYFKTNPKTKLADVAHTLQFGRVPMNYRVSFAAKDFEDAVEMLDVVKVKDRGISENQKPTIAFMFPGYGSQYAGMCKDLYASEPIFKKSVDECIAIVKNKFNKDLSPLLLADEGSEWAGKINEIEFSQPMLFVIEYALAQTLIQWGVKPDIVGGHSTGKYVAACISDVFSLEDALMLIVKRAELMQKVSKGSMLSVSISEQELLPLLKDFNDISLAAVNSTELCVVSGKDEDVEKFSHFLEQKGYMCKPLAASHAYHSYMMDEVLEEFENVIKKIKISPQQIPFLSNLSGGLATDGEIAEPEYWVKHIRETVRFSDNVEEILKNKKAVILEVGPGKVLTSLVNSNKFKNHGHTVINLVRHPNEEINDQKNLISALGKMWEQGVDIDWKNLYNPDEIRLKVSLPTYSFDKVSYPVNVDAFKMILNHSVHTIGDSSSWYYASSWKKVSLLKKEYIHDEHTLIFSDNSGVGEFLFQKLTMEGEKVTMVKKSDKYNQNKQEMYHIDPENENHYQQLFNDLAAEGKKATRIIYAWPVAKTENQHQDIADKEFFHLVNVAKYIKNTVHSENKKLVLITNDLHSITGYESLEIKKSAQLGLLKVISQECIGFSTSHIDISLHHMLNESDIQCLTDEIKYIQTGKTVSLRNSNRWEQIFDRHKIEETSEQTAFREGGVYMITGGLGNLGYNLSEYLIKNYKAKVILLGRSILPQRDQWDNEKNNLAVNRMLTLESLGDVFYYNCNIADENSLKETVQKAEEKFRTINGVIHAAGIVSESSVNMFDLLSKDGYQEHFDAKIKGIVNLDIAFKDKPLDFCFIVSSLSSILGGLGFGGYASANTFIDYFVSEKRNIKDPRNWICVNFEALDFAEIPEDPNNLNIPEIFEVVEQSLVMSELSPIVISKRDLQLRIDEWVTRNGNNTQENDASDHNALYESLAIAGGDISNAIELTMKTLWEDFFGKSVEAEDDFFEIGGDSLKALTVIRKILAVFSIEISIKEFFDNSTLEKVSKLILNKKEQGIAEIKSMPIPKAEAKEYYPLSSVQKRSYFIHEFSKTSLAYNLPRIVRLKGKIDINHITDIFRQLFDRHESLRTYFVQVNGVPVQKIQDSVSFGISIYKAEENNISHIINEFISPFKLDSCPLMRVGIIELGPEEHMLMVDNHHIISDAISQGILIYDFMRLYNNETLPELKIQYKDYVEWQLSEERMQKIIEQKYFWNDQFSDEFSYLELPTDFARPLLSSYTGEAVNIELTSQETKGLKKLAEEEKVTNYMLLLSVFNVFISKISNQEDIIVGSPVAGRQHSDLDDVIGDFVNVLPIRNFPKGNLKFSEFLSEVKTNAIACFDNQEYPFEELVDDLNVKRSTNRNPLFDVFFEYQTISEDTELKIPGLELANFNNFEEKALTVSKFDMMFSAVESSDGSELYLRLEYSYDLFKRETIERFIGYYKKIVNAVVNNPEILISDIILHEQEDQEWIYKENKTSTSESKETIVELFENQFIRTPEQIAIQDDSQVLSFEDLKKASDRTAAYLTEVKGIKPGDLVGVMLDRNIDLVPTILGVLKTGAAFVPIDIKSPAERVNSIGAESELKLLITMSKYIDSVTVHTLKLDEEANLIKEYKAIPYKPDSIDHKSIAYIIFTSGSTGKPKGVMIEHHSLVNYIKFAESQYVNGLKSTFPLFTSISFDLTITSIFTPLVTGNTIVMFPEDENESLVEKVFQNNEIDVIKLTPSHLKIVKEINFDNSNDSRRIIVGGEDLETRLAQEIFNKFEGNIEIYNEYGPTEATVGCMIYKFRPEEDFHSVPIGVPVDNTQIYLLDSSLKPVPVGVKGELYVAGAGIARGYLNNEELTQEKFLENPFIKGQKMYKTGDLAVRLADGNILFKGRIDDQIKIRGYRIELGEIESKMFGYQDIREAVVIAKETDNDKSLVAYYVSDVAVDAENLKNYLLTVLPDYMVPVNYIALDKLPLTKNGKLDKKSLPDVEVESAYKAPSNELEHMLVDIFANILKLEKDMISTTKSFFELGGNSIKVILLISNIKKVKDVKLTLKNVFDHPSVEELAKTIEQSKQENITGIPKTEKRDFYPSSSAQERMYYQQSLDPDNLAWNISTALQINNEADIPKLSDALQKLIDRHEALRTSFSLSEDGVVQKINNNVSLKLDVIKENEFSSQSDAFSGFVRPFSLSEESLLRCALFITKKGGNILFIDVHHIVCDGISLDILIKDFKALYKDQELKPLDLRYIDFAVWQRNLNGQMEKHKNYWKKKLSGQLPRLELPTLQDRENVDVFTVSTSVLEIKGELYENIKRFTSDTKVSNFMFLLSVYYLLLSKTSQNPDVIIGTDAIGRTHPELNNLVGTFVNILPLRIHVDSDTSYLDFLSKVKECVLGAFDHQDFQFDQMVALIDETQKTLRNPIVDVHFAVSDTVDGEEELNALHLTPILIQKEVRTSPYEFKIEANENNSQMNIVFIYSDDLYDENIINVLKNYFYNILNSVLQDVSVKIENIELDSCSILS
nr:non-ribosomal peptide synthetase/type I polyketide synthase [uncultured Chryseobacterium sp.]